MKQFTIIVLFFVLTIVAGIKFIKDSSAQSGESKNIGGGRQQETSTSKYQGSKLYGVAYPLNYDGENGEELKQFMLSQPLPYIYLLSPDSDGSKQQQIEISKKAQDILYQHWLKSLEYGYLFDFDNNSKKTDRLSKSSSLLQSTFNTKEELLKTPIVDNDTRTISLEEAEQMVIIVRDSVGAIVDQIKELKSKSK